MRRFYFPLLDSYHVPHSIFSIDVSNQILDHTKKERAWIGGKKKFWLLQQFPLAEAVLLNHRNLVDALVFMSSSSCRLSFLFYM